MRILFVALIYNPLSARWIDQVSDLGWELYCTGAGSPVHPLFRNITIYGSYPQKQIPKSVTYKSAWPLPGGMGRGKLKQMFPGLAKKLALDPAEQLARLIVKLKPDVIHSLKMQDEAYTVLAAARLLGGNLPCPWVYSVWGSDIYRFRHFPDHVDRIKAVLTSCDYLLADNPRDIDLAVEHGFSGKVLGVLPTGGGYPVTAMQSTIKENPSQRKIIAIKGYQEKHGGQAITALEAVQRCGAIFADYRIIVHSAIGSYASAEFDRVRAKAAEVSAQCSVPIEFLPYNPPEKIWELFARSRIAIAISNSDGTPNAMLEAMIAGAFPIQSNTGGLEPWIDSGVNGFLVPFDEVERIAEAITRAVSDDQLVDHAAEINLRETRARLDRQVIKAQTIDLYKTVVRQPVRQVP